MKFEACDCGLVKPPEQRYYNGMKSNAKSSVTLPPSEFKLVEELRRSLKAKSNVEVIRRGLTLLKQTTDRELLKLAFKKASLAVRRDLAKELDELDDVSADGLK